MTISPALRTVLTLEDRERRRLAVALTRRTLISATTAAVLLAGTDAAAQTPATGTRRVKTDKGLIEVPAQAERVVCADFFGAFAVADLGLIPLGAGGSGYTGSGEPYATLLADVPSVGDFLEPDLEAIVVLAPDLILRTIDTDDALYARLTAIAPTAVVSFQGLSLTEVAGHIGVILGRQAAADELLASYEAATTEIATTYADHLAGLTFAYVASASESTFWTMGPPWTDTTVLLDCGVRLSEPSASQTTATAEHAYEQLDILAATDVILINAEADGVTPAPDTLPLTDNPLWQTLPAVQAGQVHAIPYGAASLGAGLVLADRVRDILDDLGSS